MLAESGNIDIIDIILLREIVAMRLRTKRFGIFRGL